MKNNIKSELPSGNIIPISQYLIVGNFIFISGQGPLEVKTHKILGEDISEQTKVTIINIKNILESVGSNLGKVIKINAYLSDINDFEKFNEVYKRFFNEPYPTRTTVGCFLKDIKIEIDAIAQK